MATEQTLLLPAYDLRAYNSYATYGAASVFHVVRAVLSDSGKRLLYDVGVYDSDDDRHEEQDVRALLCS
jgi:hypothetical protein